MDKETAKQFLQIRIPKKRSHINKDDDSDDDYIIDQDYNDDPTQRKRQTTGDFMDPME